MGCRPLSGRQRGGEHHLHPQHRRFPRGHPENLCPFVRYAGVSGCLGYTIVWHLQRSWVNLGSVRVAVGMVWFAARQLGRKD